MLSNPAGMCGTRVVCVWLALGLVLTSTAAAAIAAGDGHSRTPRRSGWRMSPRSPRLSPRESPPSPPPSPRGLCLPYLGQVCAFLLYNQTVFVQPPDTLAIVEERVRDALSVVQGSPDLSQECGEFAVPGICLAAFPSCGATVDPPRGRRLCRDECEVLRDTLCKREHAIARAHPIIKQIVLPVCERLPPVGGPEAADCMRVGVPTVAPPQPAHTCFQGDGEGYLGVQTRAASGRRCRAWSRHGEYAQLARGAPAILGGHAFCRNWDGLEPEPWCYTAAAGGGVQREVCGLTRCDLPLLWYIWYIALPCAALVILCCLSATVCCLCRCARRKRAPRGDGDDTKLTAVTEKSALELEHAAEESKPQALELPLEKISFREELGEGQFGKVFRGELSGHGSDGGSLPVAVKTLKEGAAASTERDFEREGRLMAELRHPNIVRLLGTVLRHSPRCLVFERMTGGDLHALLMARSPRGPGTAGPPLTEPQLLHMAAQVADGMAYLSCHHYVHRDLAARNCLVGDNMTVKISDFGLSRDIYSSDYYRLQTRALLPVRWMPAESILYGKFTTDSDVHSYGVLLWELFSFGLQPYYGYSSTEVVEMVRRRQLLPRPEDAPVSVYQLMLDCWHQTPGRRPRFDHILSRLQGWRQDSAPGRGRPLVVAGDAGRSLSQLQDGGSRAQGSGGTADALGRSQTSIYGAQPAALGDRSASLPRGSVQVGRGRGGGGGGPASASLPRPAALARRPTARSTEVVLGRISSSSSLPSSQPNRL